MVQLLRDCGGQVRAAGAIAPVKGPLARAGDFFFFHRNWIAALMVLGLVGLLPPVFPRRSYRLDARMNVGGLLVLLTGQALRVAVIGLAYIHRGGKGGKVWADRLVTSGLFAHCRNPLYVGNILMYFGLFIIDNNPFTYAIGIPVTVLMYASIVATEEAYLRARFGKEYSRYCKRVPRWGIRLSGLGRTMRSMSFRWGRVLVKEYGTVYTWVLAVLLILGRELVLKGEWGLSHWQTIAILATVLALLPIWATIRHLKVTHRLDKGDY